MIIIWQSWLESKTLNHQVKLVPIPATRSMLYVLLLYRLLHVFPLVHGTDAMPSYTSHVALEYLRQKNWDGIKEDEEYKNAASLLLYRSEFLTRVWRNLCCRTQRFRQIDMGSLKKLQILILVTFRVHQMIINVPDVPRLEKGWKRLKNTAIDLLSLTLFCSRTKTFNSSSIFGN